MYRTLPKLRAVQWSTALMPLLQSSAAREAIGTRKGAVGPESVWQCAV